MTWLFVGGYHGKFGTGILRVVQNFGETAAGDSGAIARRYRALKLRSVVVKALRILLPLVLVGAMVAHYGLNYFSARLADQFGILGEIKLEIAPGQVALVAPTIRGYMANDIHYVLNADKISRGIAVGSPAELEVMRIDLEYSDGSTAVVYGPHAELDVTAGIMIATQSLNYLNDTGMWGAFGRTEINQNENTLRTYEPLKAGLGNGSTLEATSLELNMETGIWALENVRMLVIQSDPDEESETE